MGSIASVRQKISDKSRVERAEVLGDGDTTVFLLGHAPVLTTPAPTVWVSGVAKTESTDYSIDYDQGMITFTSAPADNSTILVQLYTAVFSDTELEEFLSQANGYDNYAASLALLALAASAARIARREALSGGSGLGSVTKDTSVMSKELRDTAKAYYDMFKEEAGGSNFPVESVTEVAWTEFGYNSILEQDLLRDF